MSFNSVIKVAKTVAPLIIYGVAVGWSFHGFEQRGVDKTLKEYEKKDEWFINYLKRDRDDYRDRWFEANRVLYNLAEELRKNGVEPHSLDFYCEYVGYEEEPQELHTL